MVPKHLQRRELKALQNTTLADIIRANTNTSNLQNNVFMFKASISGTVTNGVGTKSRSGGINQPKGVAGLTVNLINVADNEVVATTTTDARGNYSFDVNEAAQYQVQILPSGSTSTKWKASRTIAITRGDQFVGDIDFNLQLNSPIDHSPHPRGGR